MADTSVTVQTVINNSIARAKDPDKTQWSDAQMLIFCNRAVGYIHRLLITLKSELVITDSTITMVATTQEYSIEDNLPDFWSIVENGVYFPGVSVPLTPISYEDKLRCGTTTTATNPENFYITGTHIGVVNIPTSVSVTAYPTLTCRYYKANTILTLTTNMPFKNVFNESMGYFIDQLAFIKKEDPTEEITAAYNALEEATIEIVRRRASL